MIDSAVPTQDLAGRGRPLIGVAAASFAIAALALPYLVLGSLQPYLLVYPAVAGALAVALYAVSRPLYVGFSLWVWFLTPFVRRLVDYGLGAYTDESFILTAPYLVGGVGVLGLWVVLTEESRGVRQAFVLVVVALAYGIAVGVVQNPLSKAAMGALQWGIPVVSGALVLADWRQYPRYRAVVLRTITVGMGVLGLYGIYQYFVLPPWDRMWMEAAAMISLGRPLPMQVRVFGTLNAPNPYAVMMAVGLLCLLASGVRSRFDALVARLAAVPTVLGLALSQVRTGWGACAVGLICIVFLMRSRNRWRVLLFVGVLAAAVTPLLLLDSVATPLSERAGSLGSLSDDRSLNERTEMYSTAVPAIAQNPIGWGLGNHYPVDSGLLRVPISLGWAGGALYVLGFALLLLWAWRTRRAWPEHDPFIPVAVGVALALTSVLPLGAAFEEVIGVALWVFLALALAGVRYHHIAEGRVPGGGDGAPEPLPERVHVGVPG